MRKIGEPIAKATVYVCAFAFWALAMFFTYSIVEFIFRGHIEKYWLTLLVIMLGCGVMLSLTARNLIKDGIPRAVSLFRPAMPGNPDESTANPFMTKETTAMAQNENPSITFSAPVTINASTNHNASGGIIGNAPITIHQHFDKPPPAPSIIDAEIIAEAAVVPNAETASLDALQEYAESLMGKALAENTVRNVLERAAVESCGEENRGRARAKLYPKEQAEKALADYVATSKRK